MKVKNYKYLNTNGVILDKEQLKTYMQKLAMNNETNQKSDLSTYPIIRLNTNFRFIEKTYNLLNESIKYGINIHPAGEWILDNFYLIEEVTKIIQKDLSAKKYINLPSMRKW